MELLKLEDIHSQILFYFLRKLYFTSNFESGSIKQDSGNKFLKGYLKVLHYTVINNRQK